MPDTNTNVPPAASAPEPSAAARGYFNKEQLDDIALAESVLNAAQANKPALATRDIDATFLTRFFLNHHRSAVQHAADALWPWSAEASRPTRKTFALPLTRPLNL